MAWVNESNAREYDPVEYKIVEWRREGFELSTDRARLDIDKVQHFLSVQSYWAQGQPREILLRTIANSLALGLYYQGQQIGFARIVTDYARVAYLMDIFIDEAFRGKGLGTWLAEVVRTHPDLTQVPKWLLTTRDAQPVYQRAGWNGLKSPEMMMEISPANPANCVSKTLADTHMTVLATHTTVSATHTTGSATHTTGSATQTTVSDLQTKAKENQR
ncbi:GNAT family N-acetyltransferase [Rouxiella sp. T17]|uniref:GNAT family N-acetyltransferase n=1 Tax=Rouxiella sp. T17 TaxID=3085684 RepID=UPI002FCA1D66